MHRETIIRSLHGAWMLVVVLPLWLSPARTYFTIRGEYETRPRPSVTSTVVGRALRSVTVRFPIERSDVGHPLTVDSVTVFQSFVTVALRVTLNATRFGCDAPWAAPARIASRPARTMPPVAPE